MMARSRAPEYAPQPRQSWIADLMRYWPVVISMLGVIAAIVNTQRDIVELKSHVSVNGQHIVSVVARQDTMARNAEVRDYMICRVFETLVQKDPNAAKIPKRCDDVFQGWAP